MLVALLPLLLLQPAETTGTSHPWRPLGEQRPGVHLFYDPTPAARDGDTVTVRLMTRFPPSKRDPASSLSMAEIRCGDGQARVMRTLSYAADGSLLHDDTEPVPFEPIPPGSFFNAVRDAVC